MVGFINAHRDAHRVEPICNVLPIAPFTYYDHLAKRADPTRRSDRARRDEALQPEIRRVFEENWSVYVALQALEMIRTFPDRRSNRYPMRCTM
jgi:putative transposase